MIRCKDETRGLLFLAVDMLDALNIPANQVYIQVAKERHEAYRPLIDLFENIQFGTEEQGEPDLVFTDRLQPKTKAALYFPVFKADIPAKQTWPDTWIPLKNRQTFKNYLVGESESATDLLARLKGKPDLKGKRLLISAGPTAEDLDPVRYLTNRSSGKMGIALARAAFRRGAEVTLVLGPVSTPVPAVLPTIRVRSAAQMAEAVLERFPHCDAYFGAAALADYTPETWVHDKIKKQDGGLILQLKRTTDVLKALSAKKKQQKVVGFSVETRNIMENSKRKLIEKTLDMIVINNPKEAGAAFAVDTNRVTVLKKSGETVDFPLLSKLELSDRLLDLFKEL